MYDEVWTCKNLNKNSVVFEGGLKLISKLKKSSVVFKFKVSVTLLRNSVICTLTSELQLGTVLTF